MNAKVIVVFGVAVCVVYFSQTVRAAAVDLKQIAENNAAKEMSFVPPVADEVEKRQTGEEFESYSLLGEEKRRSWEPIWEQYGGYNMAQKRPFGKRRTAGELLQMLSSMLGDRDLDGTSKVKGVRFGVSK